MTLAKEVADEEEKRERKRIYAREYRMENKEKVAAGQRKYQMENKEKVKKVREIWRKNNQKNINAKARVWVEANRERLRARRRELWAIAFPPKPKKPLSTEEKRIRRNMAVRKWAAANKEKVRENERIWKKKNREKVVAWARLWRDANRQTYRIKCYEYWDKNRDKKNAYRDAWLKANPGKRREYWINQQFKGVVDIELHKLLVATKAVQLDIKKLLQHGEANEKHR